MLLQESYEQSYGIFDHSAGDNPLNIVAMHRNEQYTKNTGLYNLFRRYIKHSIKDRFGLSLTEFINLPREYVEELIAISSLEETQPAGKSTSDLNALESLLRQKK